MPDNTLPLTRVHAILDRMSAANSEGSHAAKQSTQSSELIKDNSNTGDTNDADLDDKALRQSDSVSGAMQITARLWSRHAQPWSGDALDTSKSTIAHDIDKKREDSDKKEDAYKEEG